MLHGLFIVAQWPICSVEPRDRWGFTRDDPRCELDGGRDYTRTHLPDDCADEVVALTWANAWHMSPDEVLDLDAVIFARRTMVHKAMNLRKPEYTERQYHLHKSGVALDRLQKRRVGY